MVKRLKYGNKKVDFQGISFDSKRERDRYIFLLDAQSKGLISELELQPKYELIPKRTKHITETKQLKTKIKVIEKDITLEQGISYIGDFRYVKNGECVIEDVKISNKSWAKPKEYILKRKMMLYFHGIIIKEVFNATDEI